MKKFTLFFLLLYVIVFFISCSNGVNTDCDDNLRYINDEISDTEEWYDQDNKLIRRRHSSGYEQVNEYDEAGNCVHKKCSDGFEVWYEYDSDNNLVYWKSSNGLESWCNENNED